MSYYIRYSDVLVPSIIEVFPWIQYLSNYAETYTATSSFYGYYRHLNASTCVLPHRTDGR